MRYKALALDLDGTLTNSEKKISSYNKKMILKAIQEGITVILASGRPLFGITPIAEQLGLKEQGGYILAYNGGNIMDCRSGKFLAAREMPKECIHAICELARKAGVQPVTYYKDWILTEDAKDEYVQKEVFCNNTSAYEVEDLESFVDYAVAKFLVVGPHDRLLQVQEELIKQYDSQIDAFFSESYFLEVVPKNVAKDVALDELLGHIGIQKEELIACGDGMNDIPMLKYAGLGIAMDNAYPEVKAYAQCIAPSNDQDGVAQVIQDYILA
jgi:Cof subfamily protein (haloacid dehalogenase superfamily)